VAAVCVASVARAEPPPADYYGTLADYLRRRIDAIVAAHAPKLVPPTPVKPNWKTVKVGTIDLGAPLVALAAGELDGDPKAGELYAVTQREVIAIGFKQGKLVELGRVAFSGERAVPETRDVVGTATLEGTEVVAATSRWAKELRVSWQGQGPKKTLVGKTGDAGFLVCPGVRQQLQPGRNHFANNTYELRCRADLVDAVGHPLQIRAELQMTGKLAVTVEKCPFGKGCERTGSFEYTNVGVAYAIADVDRDGAPEIIVSEASAPYATDAVKVITLGGDDRKGLYRRPFQGGVAGLVTVDGDDPDDIAEVIAAVRFPGSTRVDIWRLD
jgi:hypothetical protein